MARKGASKAPTPRQQPRCWLDRRWRHVLLAILLVAAGLRFVCLTESPPGMHQDEAANAWNAWSLLKTGMDQVGVRWPIFYFRALGENRSPLYMYYLIPFQAVGGLEIWTMRFASAVAGVGAVLLMYVVGSRLFGRGVGLTAAAMMAISPWAVQQSRWAHEATLCPLLVLLPLAVLLWAGLPFGTAQGSPLGETKARKPCPFLAALGGALAGVCCYGYPSVLQFLPMFLLAAVLVNWREWWVFVRTRRGASAVAAMVVAGAVTLGPLAWKYWTDPNISKRGRYLRVYKDTDSAWVKAGKVLERYPLHFGPGFLFLSGDPIPHYHVQDYGQLDWYMLPLMLLGLAGVAARLKSSSAARVLLLWLLLYPVGDLVSIHHGDTSHEPAGHSLRSLPGLPGLILLGAFGTVWAGTWLWRRRRSAAWAAAAGLSLAVVAPTVLFYHHYFGAYSRKEVYYNFHTQLVEACKWLRPRLEEADAVFFSQTGNQPYITTLAALQYDPALWHRGEALVNIHLKDRTADPEWDWYFGYGKVFFMYPVFCDQVIRMFQANGRKDRVYFVLSPDIDREMRQIPAFQGLSEPLHTVIGPDGQPVLLIREVDL